MAARADGGLGDGQGCSGGDTELQADEVHPGDQLGHPVFDLETRIHLQEEVRVALDQEFDGSDPPVLNRGCGGDSGLPHLGPGRWIHQDRRRLFDDLLMAALHRALAIEKMDERTVVIADHLDLDVAGRSQVAL